jgi:hypothetical protein
MPVKYLVNRLATLIIEAQEQNFNNIALQNDLNATPVNAFLDMIYGL